MIFYRAPNMEPMYRINGVDLFTREQVQRHAADMQQLQIEKFDGRREWQGLNEHEKAVWTEQAQGILRWAEAVLKEKNA